MSGSLEISFPAFKNTNNRFVSLLTSNQMNETKEQLHALHCVIAIVIVSFAHVLCSSISTKRKEAIRRLYNFIVCSHFMLNSRFSFQQTIVRIESKKNRMSRFEGKRRIGSCASAPEYQITAQICVPITLIANSMPFFISQSRKTNILTKL